MIQLLPLVLLLTPTQDAGKTLTLEQTVEREGVDFSGKTPAWKWASDGVHLVRGTRKDARWVDPVTFEEQDPPQEDEDDAAEESPADARKALREAFAKIDGVDEKRARQIASSRSVRRSDDGKTSVREHDGELFLYVEGVGARRIETGGKAELPDFSPDGKRLAFVRANDLVVLDLESDALRPLTKDGGENVFNGKLDWVYQEEIYGRGKFKGFWWSPDSRHIAFLRLDDTDVYTFTVIDHVEDGHFRVTSEISKYPKVGDPNPVVSVGVADAVSGETKWLDLSKDAEQEPLVVNLGWTPDGARVVYMVQDRIQTWLELRTAAPDGSDPRTLVRDESDSWIEEVPPPRWLDDGGFLWLSDRSGFRHVYRYDAGGKLAGAVTSGEWAVRSVLWVDEARGLLAFRATKDGSINDNAYLSKLDGTDLVRLTPGDGSHSVTFNDARTLVLDKYSSLAHPARVQLCDLTGKVVQQLAETDVPDMRKYLTSTWDLEKVPARDGHLLDVAFLKPVPFDPDASYPVWLDTYSGPNAPSVRNRWNGSKWSQFLAENGVIVLNCNVRSASGASQLDAATCYKQLGVQELRDLEDAVAWLTSKPWADGERVGISGYSYGGFMTAFALTHSDAFALGIAGGGVYDWRMYDTIYTERYMSTPEKNAEGYEKTSVLEAAGKLSGHLVLTHGTKDDNVHMQNALQLVYALQKAGKDFELMLYPESRHGVRDSKQRLFDRRLTWREIQEHLLDVGEAARPIEAGASGPSADH